MKLESMSREQAKICYEYYMTKHFPEDELKPWQAIDRMCEEEQYLCLGLFSDDATLPDRKDRKQIPGSIQRLVGYAYLALPAHCDMALLDYLAIVDDMRGRGYGSLILEKLKKLLENGTFDRRGTVAGTCRGIMIETEHEEYAMDKEELTIRLRRNAFYRSNGVFASSLKVSAFEVPFRIWQIPAKEEVSYEDLAKNYEEIYIYMCGEEMASDNIIVPL